MGASTPTPGPDIERGRAAYDRREWREAREALRRADEDSPLGPDDLWLLAVSAFLVGREDEFLSILERTHGLQRERGEPARAARSAFWMGFSLANRGEMAQASGWFGRARRLLDQAPGEHVERGYLLIPRAHQSLEGGDFEAAYDAAGDAAALAERFGDRDLLALALHLQGRARVAQARVPEGMELLDEAMVAVATGELSPQVTGLIYCSMIGACRSVYALDRAHEWTAALSDWCERQPDMVAFRGECRVYRSELMQLHGAWGDAIDEARRARDGLPDETGPAVGLALYQQGEVHRLRGDFAAAEEAYRDASRAGRQPQPGLALLRLTQGEGDAAAATIRRALSEVEGALRRARLLPASVEIMLAVDDLDGARQACEELAEVAGVYATPVLDTLVSHARGHIALRAGDPSTALPHLRQAWRSWRDLEAPYDGARARLLLGLVCRELGDSDAAAMELSAARAEFERLGAAPDVERLDTLIAPRRAGRGHGLTPRETEVLALVATGRTNRAIAEKLFISEKTVARHVSNIFAKLDVSSRSAATAYAYEHDLTEPPAP